MKLVGHFLDRFNKLSPPNDSLKTELIKALNETLNIQCSKEKISIQSGVAFVRVSSVLKNTIQINRNAVLENLFERIPRAKEIIRDIR